MSKQEVDLLASHVKRWKADPYEFVTDLWNIKLDKWQIEALRALAQHGAHVTIRSGHGVGKSTLCSLAVLWYLMCHFPCKVPITAPTSHQLRDVLWSEISKWIREMPKAIGEMYDIRSGQQDLSVSLVGAKNRCFAVGRTSRADKPEALQGFHEENLMFIIDEASGIDDRIFEVARGSLSTDGAKILLTGNPTRNNGYFYNSHNSKRASWRTFRIGPEESSIMSTEYVQQMRDDYGEDSNIYRVRVLGEFPRMDDDSLLSLDILESAAIRNVEVTDSPIIWGLDVARTGRCRTALARRKGNHLLKLTSWEQRDTMEVAGIIIREYEEEAEKPAVIYVDSVGIGAGVYDRLRELNMPVRCINIEESGGIKPGFINKRAESYWRMKEWFESKMVYAKHERLIAQLSTIKYEIKSNGKIKIEGKEDMLNRGIKSPDEADAFSLTFLQPDIVPQINIAPARYSSKKKRSSAPWAR